MIPTPVRLARAEAAAHIARVLADAAGELERLEAWKLRPAIRGAAEWDWFWHLRRAERVRVSAWFDRCADGPDVVADRAGKSIDAAMAGWLHHTRIVDAHASMQIRKSRGGYVPGTASLGGWGLDDLFPDSGYRLAELFQPMPACAAYIGSVEDDHWTTADTSAYVAELVGA